MAPARAGSVVENRGREPVSDDDVEEIPDQPGDRNVAARSLTTEASHHALLNIDRDRARCCFRLGLDGHGGEGCAALRRGQGVHAARRRTFSNDFKRLSRHQGTWLAVLEPADACRTKAQAYRHERQDPG
jgi:hypothetical protein